MRVDLTDPQGKDLMDSFRHGVQKEKLAIAVEQQPPAVAQPDRRVPEIRGRLILATRKGVD